MKQNNKSSTFAVAMAVVIIFVKAWTCAAQTTSPSLVDDEVVRFQKKAEKVGYVVQEGLPVKTNLNDLYCDGLTWAPLYPNPNAPYISAILPNVPGQAKPVVSNGSFRLREDEAIVVIGVTPPQMAYFSFNFHMLRGSLKSEVGPVIEKR